jgi:hypothetical protein
MVITNTMRSALVAAALGAATAVVLAVVVQPSWAQDAAASAVSIDSFTFHAANVDCEGRQYRDLDQQGRYPARHCLGQ